MNSITERNKEIVRDFLILLSIKNYKAAAEKYIGKTYIQHNPLVEDGPHGLEKFINFLRAEFPEARSEIKRIFADGDYVILHVHSLRKLNTRGRA